MTEKDFAKRIGAKLVKNSGRGFRKGDMRLGKYLIDLKEVSKSFTVNKAVWGKISSDASTYGWDTVPMLVLKFEDGPTLAVLNYDDLEIEDDS